MRKDAGVTLVALIITIIVLLILAGITITSLFGENGIITKATTASLMHSIEKGREQIGLVLDEDSIERGVKKIELTSKRVEKIFEEKDWVKNVAEVEENIVEIINEEGHVYEIIVIEGKIKEIIYMGKDTDTDRPIVTLSFNIDESSNGQKGNIKINAQEQVNGIEKIEIIQTGDSFVYNGEKQVEEEVEIRKNGKYIVRVTSKTGKITRVSIMVTELAEIDFTNVTWVGNGTAKVGITTYSNLQIQYSIQGIEGSWNNYTQGEEITGLILGQTVYGRLWNGEIGIGVASIIIKDSTPPNEFSITISNVEETSFRINASTIDEQSGIKEYKYYVEGELKGTIVATETYFTVTELTVGTNYTNIYVEAVDKAGNIKKSTNTLTQTTLYQTLASAGVERGDLVNYTANGFSNWIIYDTTSPITLVSNGSVGSFTAHGSQRANFRPMLLSYASTFLEPQVATSAVPASNAVIVGASPHFSNFPAVWQYKNPTSSVTGSGTEYRWWVIHTAPGNAQESFLLLRTSPSELVTSKKYGVCVQVTLIDDVRTTGKTGNKWQLAM